MGGIRERLRKDGAPLRKPGTRPIPVDDEVPAQLREQGYSVPAIGKVVGMNFQTIYSRLRERRLSPERRLRTQRPST